MLALIAGIFSVILMFIILIVLRIFFIYWEITIVVNDCGAGQASALSLQYFQKRTPDTAFDVDY